MPRPIVLTILDGWGYRAETNANAIAAARKPNYDKLLAEFPNTLLRASEQFVGLPGGQMGNSEVGHLNLGAGRIVRMDMTRIDTAIMAGRDTLPTGAVGYLEELTHSFKEYGVGRLASVSGRYFAMDRDLRWEKEAKAFRAMVGGHPEGGRHHDPLARVRESYNNGITDEFIEPFVCVDEHSNPVGLIAEGDA